MVPPRFFSDQLTLSQPEGGRLCPPNNTGTPGFSDLPMALLCITEITLYVYLFQIGLFALTVCLLGIVIYLEL